MKRMTKRWLGYKLFGMLILTGLAVSIACTAAILLMILLQAGLAVCNVPVRVDHDYLAMWFGVPVGIALLFGIGLGIIVEVPKWVDE